MNRSDDAPETTPDRNPEASSELHGFGFELSDEAWLTRVRAAKRALDPGSIGAYRLVEEISRGAQGIVHRGRQPKTNREIAVKRLIAGRFATPAARERFTREIETAATLNHPNVVTVYGAEVIDDQPVLAMEWVDGVPIDEWAQPDGAPPPERCVSLR